MKRILLSAGVLSIMGLGLYIGATGAFFSDTETSTGNTFTAGDIDLQIGNTSYVTSSTTGALVASPSTSWSIRDLTVERFFNFIDVKPGDIGEDTIAIQVGSNSAWMCAAAQITEDLDNDITDPEDDEGGPAASDGTPDGDLDSELEFVFWVDDGDNVYETSESIFLEGPLSGIDDTGQIRLADSSGSILGGTSPIPGGTTFNIGKAWCFGNLTPNGTAQDGVGTSNPITRGTTGFTCDGSDASNIAQTDSVKGDLQFFAVQSRNNPTFTCAEDFDPEFPDGEEEGTVVVNANNLNGWIIDNFDDATDLSTGATATVSGTDGDFVVGPGTPPTGTGSFQQDIGTDGDDAQRLMTNAFNGLALSSITQLEYSTYVSAAISDQATYIQLRIDRDGDGDTEDRIFFEPVYQNGTYALLSYSGAVPNQCVGDPSCVVNNTWQSWDADAGGWWSLLDNAGGPPITSFTSYVAQYPGAKLATDGPAFRMQAGGGVGAWDNFLGNFDELIVNGTTYNFEL